MGMRMFGILILSGLCHVGCTFDQYYLVNSSKTWVEAQQHCQRAKGDLASVSDLQHLKALAGLLKDNNHVVFLGLRREWGWSVSEDDDYREGEPVYWNWADNEPSQQDCVSVGLSGKWFSTNCSTKLNFFCYNASTTGIVQRFTLIEGSSNWSNAQAYCRRRYTDLAWVRNKHENKELIPNNLTAWIGLSRMSWRWSDGSQTTFVPWKTISLPHDEHGDCGALDVHDKIHGIIRINCGGKAPFFCSRGPLTNHWLSVRLSSDDAFLQDLDATKSLLTLIKMRLGKVGLLKDVELSWWKPPEKDIKMEKTTPEHKECLFNDSYISFI